jgi:DNA-directed RNA polymerase specialized sigma24 family protein
MRSWKTDRGHIDWGRAELTDGQRGEAESVIPLACLLVRRYLPALEPGEVLSLAGEASGRAVYTHAIKGAGFALGTFVGWQVRAAVTRWRAAQRGSSVRAHPFGSMDGRLPDAYHTGRTARHLDAEDDGGDGFDVAERNRDPVGAGAAAREEWAAALGRVRAAMDERLWRFLWLRHAEGWMLSEIGRAEGGLTKERVRQLLHKALAKARAALAGGGGP